MKNGAPFRRILAVAAAGFLSIQPAAGFEAKTTVAGVPGGIAELWTEQTGGGSAVLLRNGGGEIFRIVVDANGAPALRLLAGRPALPESRPDMLPDGIITRGGRNISRAWLTGPTGQYRHGVIGDAIEASGLTVVTGDGQTLTIDLDPRSVFEDRFPRLADMDGDGTDEIFVIRSYHDRGAALAMAAVRNGKLSIVAETPAIGRPNRWLNPVGVADFDGDGRAEAAVVVTPHIGGWLTLYELEGSALRQKYREGGFSNHAIGSRELGWSALADMNGDGITDAVVPDARRRDLRFVTFAGGRFREFGRTPLAGGLSSAIVAADLDGDGRPDVLYGTADGRLVRLSVNP